MDLVLKLSKVATGPGPGGHRDVPLKPIVIESARVLGSAARPEPASNARK